MNLQATDFELFGLPERFAQDAAAITERWKALQRETHPDKFAAQGAAAQRVALQYAARVNEAHTRLKSPLPRAAYLCSLRGSAVNAQNNNAMSADFLMQQMQWRSDLDDAQSEAQLDNLAALASTALANLLAHIERCLDVDNQANKAALAVAQAMFIEKFRLDLEAAYDRLAA
jgi:molecular chaperone HscB